MDLLTTVESPPASAPPENGAEREPERTSDATLQNAPGQKIPLAAALALFDNLSQGGVRYCHWKSNLRLDHALAGKTDLDLLVDPAQGHMFRQTLAAHNVKPVLAAPGKEYPGVENYLGFDRASGQMFHLHVHYQLVLGEQFVKNYRLPLERYLLDSAQLRSGVPVPAPEWELSILAVRALLKYRDRDGIKDMLKVRTPGLPDYILAEIYELLAQTSLERVERAFVEVGHILPARAIVEFLRTVTAHPRSGWRFLQLRNQVRRSLRPYQRFNRAQAAAIYFREMLRRDRRFARFRHGRKARSVAGGRALALVGADGAGKSTLCDELYRWLSWKLEVHRYYLGSKQPSRRSRVLYLLFRMARRTHSELVPRLGEGNPLVRTVAGVRQTLLHAHQLSIGWDRYRRTVRGARAAADGFLVIYDRFPLAPQLDGPKIHLDAMHDGTGLGRWLARRFAQVERRIYRTMRPPDALLVLDVDPDVSLQRKPDHDRAAVESKSIAIRALVEGMARESATGVRFPNVLCVDANQPYADVVRQMKDEVWRLL